MTLRSQRRLSFASEIRDPLRQDERDKYTIRDLREEWRTSKRGVEDF